jgi:OOP family OmpA-OmpF porin
LVHGTVALGAALLASACGGSIHFKDSSALTIVAQGPEEPKPEPPPKPKRVRVKATNIEIDEKIQFAKGEATILAESHSLLDEVVEVFKENPQIKKVSIEGHTSSEGGALLNRTLSENRAKAVVEYLVSKGIEAERLQAKGFGPDTPLAENDTEENREKNLRVEFNITKQTAKK